MTPQSYSINRPADWARIVIELSKVRISQLVAMSTLVGYIMATGSLSPYIVIPTLGTFLLACGSAALNQYQERKIDRQMRRTRLRPIPAGRITPGEGLVVAAILLVLGAAVLFWGTNLTALSLGLFNVFWYNGVYTPLKRKTAFAVFPGSLIGAIPPAIGWAAAGRSLLDPQMLALAFFFFIWQVPHFWLLLLNLGKDYETAGLPSLTSMFDDQQLGRMTFIWTIATAVACLMIPLFGLGHSTILFAALLAFAGWLIWRSRKLLYASVSDNLFRSSFVSINIYMLMVMVALSLDRLLSI